MILIGNNIVILDWLGFSNNNTCLVSYFNVNGAGVNRNVSATVFPLKFWNHIGCKMYDFGYNNKRLYIGIGFLSFSIDFATS